MFLKPFQIFHLGQSLVSGFLLRLDCGRPEGRSKQVSSFNCNLCESIYSFYTDYTLWREEKRRAYIWSKSSHYSRLAAHHSHPSSLEQLSFSSLGSVCVSQTMTCCFLLSAAETFVKVWLWTSSHQYTAAEAFLGGGGLNLSPYSKFMIDVMSRNLICLENHKLIKTYKSPPMWKAILYIWFMLPHTHTHTRFCHCKCASAASLWPPVSTVILLTPVSAALPLISPALLSITL